MTTGIAPERSSAHTCWIGGSGWPTGSTSTTTACRAIPTAGARLEAERRGGEVVDAALGWLRRCSAPVLPLDPLVRSAHPLHATGGVPGKGRRAPYDGEVRIRGRAGRARRRRRCVSAGCIDRAVIAIAGDHGEGLGEHGEATHGMLAYDTTLRVPLVVVAPALGHRGDMPDRCRSPIFAGSAPQASLRIEPPDEMGGWFLLSVQNRRRVCRNRVSACGRLAPGCSARRRPLEAACSHPMARALRRRRGSWRDAAMSRPANPRDRGRHDEADPTAVAAARRRTAPEASTRKRRASARPRLRQRPFVGCSRTAVPNPADGDSRVDDVRGCARRW